VPGGSDEILEEAVERRLLPDHVDDLARADGIGALRVPGDLVEQELPGGSRGRRVAETLGSFAIVAVLFGVALPRLTGAHYGDVWATLTGLGWWHFSELTAVWLVTMWCYSGVLVASLPGLRRSQALTLNFAGSAVANVVPFGGAVGVGATYAMTRSWGFTIPTITRSIVVTGFWNIFAKLGIPVAALAMLSFSGQATSALVAASLTGVALLLALVVVFALVLRSDALAAAVGRVAQHLATAAVALIRRPPVTGLPERFVAFRHDSVGLLREHWLRLSFWMVAYTLGQFTILLLCVRFLGAGNDLVGWVEVFAAFAFNRLLTTIPLTPSGVGIAETGTVALLTAFGAATNPATAAVLLYSAFTYLFEIPLGLTGWAVWAGNKRWRRPVGSVGVTPDTLDAP
jgi:putative heme transporter